MPAPPGSARATTTTTSVPRPSRDGGKRTYRDLLAQCGKCHAMGTLRVRTSASGRRRTAFSGLAVSTLGAQPTHNDCGGKVRLFDLGGAVR